jgi:serine/threonine protein kinase
MSAGSLLDLVKRNRVQSLLPVLPPLAIGAIVHQILMGLSYLHRERRIIHRGLHPGNILLDSSGR